MSSDVMTLFAALANDLGAVISYLLYAACYLGGVGLCIWAVFDLVKQAESRHQPWQHGTVAIAVKFLVGILCLNFDKFLNAINGSLGAPANVGLGNSPLAYTAPPASSMVGATPMATLANIVNMASYYFAMFGALMIYSGLMGLKSVSDGQARGGLTPQLVKIVFGALVANATFVVAALQYEFGG